MNDLRGGIRKGVSTVDGADCGGGGTRRLRVLSMFVGDVVSMLMEAVGSVSSPA